jgi:hypothetical protein
MTSVHKTYSRPPIAQRVICAYTAEPISEENFSVKTDSWRGLIKEQFPILDAITKWDINIEEKNGIPTMSDAGSTMHIENWFWQHPPKQG